MFPKVFWNIFNLRFTDSAFYTSAIRYIIILRAATVACFAIVLRNVAASLYLVGLLYITAAFFCARHLLFNTTCCCVVARLVAHIAAITLTTRLFATILRWAAILRADVLCSKNTEQRCANKEQFFHKIPFVYI